MEVVRIVEGTCCVAQRLAQVSMLEYGSHPMEQVLPLSAAWFLGPAQLEVAGPAGCR